MPRPPARLFLAAIGLAAACSVAAAPRTYTLPEHGVLWSTKDHPKVTDLDSLRSNVEAAAKSAEQQSTEGTLSVRELPGSQGRGFQVAATDAAPNPGAYNYMAQGLVQVGTVALAFTALTNDGEDDVVKTALAIVKSASHQADRK